MVVLQYMPGAGLHKNTSRVYPIKLFTGAYPRVEHLKGAYFMKAPALPTNIRLGWNGLPGTNTLTYNENV